MKRAETSGLTFSVSAGWHACASSFLGAGTVTLKSASHPGTSGPVTFTGGAPGLEKALRASAEVAKKARLHALLSSGVERSQGATSRGKSSLRPKKSALVSFRSLAMARSMGPSQAGAAAAGAAKQT